jgi:hypothetical protein
MSRRAISEREEARDEALRSPASRPVRFLIQQRLGSAKNLTSGSQLQLWPS